MLQFNLLTGFNLLTRHRSNSMTSNYKDYAETNTSKNPVDESLVEKVFLGYIDKITDIVISNKCETEVRS